MQDIHHIGGGGGGRFFGGGGGGGDRRLRPHSHHQAAALKCPRCDSLNTKFCYYNNYNLSQPRHFCKNCRRYWTKGGVLRNVPVGGGCRKAKRSRHKPPSSTTADDDKDRNNNNNSNNVQSSSSDSSSLTAAATAAIPTPTTVEEGSNSTTIFNFSDSRFVNPNPSFDNNQPPILNRPSEGQIFGTDTFASMMTSPPAMMTTFGEIPSGNQAANPASTSEFKMDGGDGGLAAALEWGNGGDGTDGGDQGLFDLTADVDPATYWSQPQWTDSDNTSLNYLP